MGREFDRGRAPQVRERPGTDNRGSSRIGADDAGRAGRAMERRLQFAQQIVMLERRRDEAAPGRRSVLDVHPIVGVTAGP